MTPCSWFHSRLKSVRSGPNFRFAIFGARRSATPSGPAAGSRCSTQPIANPAGARLPAVLLFALVLAWSPNLHAQNNNNNNNTAGDAGKIVIVKSSERLIPITLTGLAGEAGEVVRFDLELQGFRVVSPESAQYEVAGEITDSLNGRLIDRVSKTTLLANAYRGGKLRSQAHSFADDIVEKLTGNRGISRTRIAFKVDTGRNSEIYVADFDGHGATAVTADNAVVAAPAWIPGKLAMYYTSYKLGNPDIYFHDLSTRARNVVARYPGLNTGAAVSPDGRRIAMILSKNGSPDLYVADANGSNLKQLTRTKEDESSPCWSPDGSTICLVSRLTGRAALYTISASGGEMRRLRTDGAINTTEPDWSPDGKTIVLTAQMGGFQLFTVPATGGEATSLDRAGEDPSWAPNSRHLIFTRRVEGRRVLSLLDAQTKHVKDVARLSGNCSQPCWAR